MSFVHTDASLAAARHADEPQTTTIRIRLRGPTLRVRCRRGDCVVTIVGTGTSYAVSVTRTRNGVPFTFAKTVENPTNVAVETGTGNDRVSLSGINIPGFLRINTGKGDDVLEVADTSAAGKGAIDTGPGNDVVRLDAESSGGKFHLATRDGDDVVTISGGHFASKAGFDGGAGTDGLAIPTASFAVPPVVHGFEP